MSVCDLSKKLSNLDTDLVVAQILSPAVYLISYLTITGVVFGNDRRRFTCNSDIYTFVYWFLAVACSALTLSSIARFPHARPKWDNSIQVSSPAFHKQCIVVSYKGENFSLNWELPTCQLFSCMYFKICIFTFNLALFILEFWPTPSKNYLRIEPSPSEETVVKDDKHNLIIMPVNPSPESYATFPRSSH